MMHPIIVIPARLESTRLPRKPLADIGGIPMIVHVLRRAEAAACGPVYVACDGDDIADVVTEAGGHAILTDPELPSGTDRVHAALQQIDPKEQHDIVINIQGDLPLLEPQAVQDVLLPFRRKKDVAISTLVSPITDDAEATDPHVVKAVITWDYDGELGRALYFTRATAPWGEGPLWHHIGLYAYTREALTTFTQLPTSLLERREKLEQLRALEHNMHLAVVKVDHIPLGVDTAEDLEKARTLYESS